MGVGESWFQQGPGNAGATIGKVLDASLTWAASKVTAGVASGVLAAASTSNTRKVIIFVPASEVTGITINFGAAAVVATHFFIPNGGSLEIDTLQAINVIRAGASDVTVNLLLGTA